MADCHSCSSRSSCASATADGSCPSNQMPVKQAPAATSRIQHVIAIASGKGGVGKSTITAWLAVEFRRMGLSVGILDADLTGPSLPQAFALLGQTARSTGDRLLEPLESSSGIKLMSVNVLLEDPAAPVVWRGPILASVVKQFWQEVDWGQLDVLLIDMPPGTSDVSLSVFQSIPLDGLITVTTPQDLVNLIVRKAARMAEMMQLPLLGFIENMSYYICPDCGGKHAIFGEGLSMSTAEQLGCSVLAKLPVQTELARLMDRGQIENIKDESLRPVAEKIWKRLSANDEWERP